MKLVITLFLLCFAYVTGARVVESDEDYERLKGFWQHEEQNKKFDAERLSGLQEYKQQKRKIENLLLADLIEYRAIKRNSQQDNDSSQEYQEYLVDKFADWKKIEQGRHEYMKQKENLRISQRKTIDLSEIEELKIADKDNRVEWRKRKFSDTPGGRETGSGSSNPSFDSSNFPPPPPPLPMPYDPPPSYYDDLPPPPPPPPPIFDDDGPF